MKKMSQYIFFLNKTYSCGSFEVFVRKCLHCCQITQFRSERGVNEAHFFTYVKIYRFLGLQIYWCNLHATSWRGITKNSYHFGTGKPKRRLTSNSKFKNHDVFSVNRPSSKSGLVFSLICKSSEGQTHFKASKCIILKIIFAAGCQFIQQSF